MAIVSDVEIRLRADIARLQADMDAARRSVGGAMGSITTAVRMAGAAMAAFVGAAVIGAVLKFASSLKEMVTGAIDAAGSLNDLSIQTGASVAALMQFKLIGATSDTTAESLAGAMNKLSKGMASTTEESKGIPGALAAIGLNFKDIKKLAPDMQMIAVAKAMDRFGDGAGKSSVAMALYGKEGAKLLPFLKDLAAQSDKVTASLTDQEKKAAEALAAMADNYGDNLTKIQQSNDETRKAISLGMLPALYEASEAFIAVTNEAGGLKDQIKKLSTDGTIAEWTRNAITGLTYLIDVMQVMGRLAMATLTIIKTVTVQGAQAFMGLATSMVQFIRGDYQKSWDTVGETVKTVKATAMADAATLSALATEDTWGKKMRAQLAIAKAVKAEVEDSKPQVDHKAAANAESNKVEEKRLKVYRDLKTVIEEHIEVSAREAAGMEPLNAAQKEMIKVTAELKSGKLQLLPAEEEEIKSRIRLWEANLAAIDSQKALVKMNEELVKAEKMMAGDRAEVLKKAGEEATANEELARTFGMTKAAIEADELARMRKRLAQRGDLALTADEIEQLEKLIALKERSAAAVADVEAQKQVQEFWTSIDKTAHDTFVSITAGGKDAFTRLKDTAKNVFFDWLYQMTLKKWVLNIGTAIDGPSAVSAIAGATGATNGAGGLGSLMSAGSSLSNIFTAMTGGGVGTGFVGSLLGGLNGAGMGSGLTSSIGLSIGNSVASVLGPAVSGALSTGLGALATALPWVAAGAAVFAIGKKAFGMGDKNVSGTTLNGSLSGGGFSGSMDSAWTQKGGWFRSDKSGVDRAAVDATVAASLGAAYQSITSTSMDYAKALGLSADTIAGRTQSLSIALGKDEAANQKAIEAFFVGVGDNIARELLPNIAMFQQAGESAAATLQRLASNFQSVGAVLAQMNTTTAQAFGATGAAAIEASERLVALAGGVQALASQAKYFADNFLSKAEQVAPAQKQMTDVLAALGYGYVKTVDQYKTAVLDLAKSGALATEAGAATYAALLQLAPAFKTVTDYANELKQAANDSAGAALDALSKAVDAQKNVVTAAYTAAMDVLDARISGLNDTISATSALSKALKDGVMGTNTPAAGIASRQVAVAQVGAALAIAKASGLLPSADSLSDALAAIKSTSVDQFATLADYQRSVAQSNAALEQLGGLTDGQLSAAEQQLAATIAQKDAAAAANEAQLARLDALVAAAQAQIAAVNGVNTSLMTVGQALVGVYSAVQVLSGYTGISATTVAPTGTASATIDTGALLAELQTLNARIANMEAHAATTASSTDQFARQFNNVSAGGNALLTETA